MIRLYYTEPWRREFDAVVVAAEPSEAGTSVRLDRTAFYPTSGGQPHDTGALTVLAEGVPGADPGVVSFPVVDVREDERTGSIDHVVNGALAAGQCVRGVIDWRRRADHMQQHTGQHILSAAFDHLAGARTVSFHLGASASTIDLARDVTTREVADAEREANRIVWENRPVSIRFVSEDEAARLPLRKEPTRGGRLRLIEVQDFDLSACGGTHVSRTGEIGTIGIRGWERFKGGTRVEFLCGARALEAWRGLRDAVTASVRLISTLPHELPAAIERLQNDSRDLKRSIKDLSQRLAGFEAQALASRAVSIGSVRVIVEVMEGYDPNGLKAMCLAATNAPGHVAVLFSASRPASVAASRSAGIAVDCQQLLRGMFDRFGGRGGGRPEMAQGGGLDAPAESLVAAATELLSAALT